MSNKSIFNKIFKHNKLYAKIAYYISLLILFFFFLNNIQLILNDQIVLSLGDSSKRAYHFLTFKGLMNFIKSSFFSIEPVGFHFLLSFFYNLLKTLNIQVFYHDVFVLLFLNISTLLLLVLVYKIVCKVTHDRYCSLLAVLLCFLLDQDNYLLRYALDTRMAPASTTLALLSIFLFLKFYLKGGPNNFQATIIGIILCLASIIRNEIFIVPLCLFGFLIIEKSHIRQGIIVLVLGISYYFPKIIVQKIYKSHSYLEMHKGFLQIEIQHVFDRFSNWFFDFNISKIFLFLFLIGLIVLHIVKKDRKVLLFSIMYFGLTLFFLMLMLLQLITINSRYFYFSNILLAIASSIGLFRIAKRKYGQSIITGLLIFTLILTINKYRSVIISKTRVVPLINETYVYLNTNLNSTDKVYFCFNNWWGHYLKNKLLRKIPLKNLHVGVSHKKIIGGKRGYFLLGNKQIEGPLSRNKGFLYFSLRRGFGKCRNFILKDNYDNYYYFNPKASDQYISLSKIYENQEYIIMRNNGQKDLNENLALKKAFKIFEYPGLKI